MQPKYITKLNWVGCMLSPKGDLTSQWVIHYQKFSELHIKAVDISPHPPLELPEKSKF